MDIIQEMADKHQQERIMLKVLEEMAELQEVLIKTITKKEGLKPSKEKIIEEIGDVFFRTFILMRKMDIDSNVQNRILNKASIVEEWFKKEYKIENQ